MGVVTMTDVSYEVNFPDEGWVWGPDPAEDVAAWAQQVCMDLEAEGQLEVELAEQLRGYALTLRDKQVDAGALWIPQVRFGVLAALYTDRLIAHPDELTMDYIADLERQAHLPGTQPPEVSYVDLPAGPAVRCRRLEMFEGPSSATLAESVSHVVIVPGFTIDGAPAAVRQVMTWTLLSEGDDLAGLADDCASLLRLG